MNFFIFLFLYNSISFLYNFLYDPSVLIRFFFFLFCLLLLILFFVTFNRTCMDYCLLSNNVFLAFWRTFVYIMDLFSIVYFRLLQICFRIVCIWRNIFIIYRLILISIYLQICVLILIILGFISISSICFNLNIILFFILIIFV